MPRKSVYRAVADIDREALAEFQAGIRKRYTDEQILAELKQSAERLGRSPTMREFAADSKRTVHPETVIEHFGSWNRAKRKAGLVPRRFATREELLALLQELGKELGRVPTARDIDEHRGKLPSKSLYWHTFGSLTNALREAGFDVPVGEERLERALDQAVSLSKKLGRLPKFADWTAARKTDDAMLTECSTPGAGPGRRSSSSYGNGYARPASTWPPTGRSAKPTACGARLVSGGGQDRQPLQAQCRLFWSAHGRQRRILEASVGVESLSARLAAELELDEGAFLELVHLQLHAEEALHDLEPELRRGEEHAVVAGAKPDRAADAARNRDRVFAALVDPGGRHRAAQGLERLGGALRVSGDGEDGLGVDRHSGLSPRAVVVGEQLVVVVDDPVVNADDRAVADRMVVRSDGWMTFRVVPDVDQDFGRTLRNGDLFE
jgi:hypothetical protein